MPQPEPTDPVRLQAELELIQRRLAAMVTGESSTDMGVELAKIRSDLHRLARENDDVQALLRPILGENDPPPAS